MLNAPLAIIVMSGGLILFLVGLWGMLTRKNIIKIILGFSLIDTGIHMVIVAIGYMRGKTAPIIEKGMSNAADIVVDPIPSALVLTAIVIGLGVTALMLTFAIQMYQKKKTLSIDEYTELKW
jgi:multisubunit Na+/H+ antiporter MnhC subunit